MSEYGRAHGPAAAGRHYRSSARTIRRWRKRWRRSGERGRQGRVREEPDGQAGLRVLHQVPNAAEPLDPCCGGPIPPVRRAMTAHRSACWAGILLVAILAVAAEAQQARRPYRIGVLNEAWAASHPTVEELKAGLRELGLEEGRDIRFDIRFTEGNLDAMPVAAAALVKADVDLIFTSQY